MKNMTMSSLLLASTLALSACSEKSQFFDKSSDSLNSVTKKKKKQTTEVDTETPDTEPGTQTPGTEPGTQTPGTEPGTQTPGTEPGTQTPGTEPGTQTPGTQPGTQTPGTQPGTQTPGTQPGTQTPGTQPGTQTPGTQPGTQTPGTQPGTQTPGTQPGTQTPGTQPGTQTPGTQPGTQTPSTQPGTQTPSTQPGTQTPGTQPGTQTPGTQPGTQTPGTQPGTQTPGTEPGTQTPGTEPGTQTPGTQPGTQTPGTQTPSTQNPPKEEGPKFRIVKASEDFEQVKAKSHKLDIVWVVDNSGSMADEQEALGRNFNAFISNFVNTNVDFRMAITTTDTRETWKGLVVKGSMESLNSAAAKKNHAAFVADFMAKIKVGTKGSGTEGGLQSITNFVEVHGDKFLREDAYLIVIVVTDEDDQSRLKVADYAEELKKSKADSKNIKVFSIVDAAAKSVTEATLVKGSRRYKEFSLLTNGQVIDIRQDFHKSLKLIANSVVELINNFKLAYMPEAKSVKVQVNGKVVPTSAYRVSENVVIFEKGSEPEEGSEIEVEYEHKEAI